MCLKIQWKVKDKWNTTKSKSWKMNNIKKVILVLKFKNKKEVEAIPWNQTNKKDENIRIMKAIITLIKVIRLYKKALRIVVNINVLTKIIITKMRKIILKWMSKTANIKIRKVIIQVNLTLKKIILSYIKKVKINNNHW
jgi:hypothetical protein